MTAGPDCPSTDLDLWADDVLVDPYPAYADLRELGPVVWMTKYAAYALPRYDEVRAVLQDWRRFTSARGVGMDDAMNARSGRGILTTDPPLHDTSRKVLNAQLVPRALTTHEAGITARAEALVADLLERGSFDAVADLAQPYSVGVVADLVGLPEEGREHLLERAAAAFNTFGPDNDLLRSSLVGFRELFDYCTGFATPERLTPERWGSQIYAAGERGDIEPDACPGLMLAYAWAGMDTTVNALSAAVWLFARCPDQWDLVRGDPSLVPSAFNEVLRIEPPVQRFTRLAANPVELDGTVLPEGSRVAVLFGSANRDERHFDDPDRFDVARNPVDHLSFGRGIHHCVGAGLARLEGHAIIAALAARVERFEIGDAFWRRNNALHGLASLDVQVHS
ncbi:MAG TPA: cytochrome P450 [Ilumatobacteraceae bacterium]|nr:cytochrome P450 [Ilumatobacteraceae bacterium]